MVTIDTHTDTPLNFLRTGFDFSGENNTAIGSKVDLAKMEKGGLDAAFFAVFIGQRECTPERYTEVNARAMEIFNAIYATVKQYPSRAAIATTPDDVYRLKKEGKRAIYIGVENGYPIGDDIGQVKAFYDLGARYITLCHTRNNQICDSSTDPDGPRHSGLSEFGRKVVQEMNRLGMMVDVSHISDKAFYDVLEVSKAPVIASHSCARAICDNPRNLTDDMLRALAKNGGVVQMCILSEYVKKGEPNPARDSAYRALRTKWNNFRGLTPEQEKQATTEWYELEEKYPVKLATVADVVDHIDHMVKVMGIDHVGIGTDFDGGGGVDGCRDASQMYHITMELLRRGYSEKDIRKIWGENFLRVFREVEKRK
jgi:membrane dipeptidase